MGHTLATRISQLWPDLANFEDYNFHEFNTIYQVLDHYNDKEVTFGFDTFWSSWAS